MNKNNPKPPFLGLMLMISFAAVMFISLGVSLKKTTQNLILPSQNVQEKSDAAKASMENF